MSRKPNTSVRLPEAMTRRQIYRLFLRHDYNQARVCEALGVYSSAVAQWFSGKSNSRRIDEFVRKKAAELLALEQ